MAVLQDYRIALNYNVALVSLVNIESITPSGDRPFVVLNSYGSYNKGILKPRGDGSGYFSGKASLRWLFGGMTFKQHTYLVTNFGYVSKVTIYTRLDSYPDYYRMNAIMTVPQLDEITKLVNAFSNVPIVFSRVRTAT